MRLAYSWVMTMVAAGVLSCGDDGSDDTSAGSADGSEGGASTETTSTSSGTGSSSAASTEGSSSEGSTATEDTTGVTTACGDALTCAPGEVCVQEPLERPCEIVEEGEPCPPDQMPSMCGGAGVPCCCGEPPPPDYSCVVPEGCDGVPTCACIECAPDRSCAEPMGDGPFVCELLPQP